MNLIEITNDLNRLEAEISSAEKELSAAEAKRDLLLKQGLDHDVKNVQEAQKIILQNQKKMVEYEGLINEGYTNLKENYEW